MDPLNRLGFLGRVTLNVQREKLRSLASDVNLRSNATVSTMCEERSSHIHVFLFEYLRRPLAKDHPSFHHGGWWLRGKKGGVILLFLTTSGSCGIEKANSIP